MVEIQSSIFKSDPAERQGSGSRFRNQSIIQGALYAICENWVSYLKNYVNQTGSGDLFDEPELPWKDTERAMVGTLSSSISRSFPGSVVLEEGRVQKGESKGRCDLWASIPNLGIDGLPFSFYLEAKRSQSTRGTGSLTRFLKSKNGISKLFRDYAKGRTGKLTQRSAYSNRKDRSHDHYVIGLLISQLKTSESDFKTAGDSLMKISKEILDFELKSTKEDSGTPEAKTRRLDRFPMVAVTVLPEEKRLLGMIAVFIVLGSTKELSAGRSE